MPLCDVVLQRCFHALHASTSTSVQCKKMPSQLNTSTACMLSTAQEYKTRAASKSIAGGGRSKKQASDAASFRPYAGASRPRRRSTLVVVDSGQPRRRITLRAHQNPGAVRCTSGSSPRRDQHLGVQCDKSKRYARSSRIRY